MSSHLLNTHSFTHICTQTPTNKCLRGVCKILYVPVALSSLSIATIHPSVKEHTAHIHMANTFYTQVQMKSHPQFHTLSPFLSGFALIILLPLPISTHLSPTNSSSPTQWPITQHAVTDTCNANIINQYQWNCVEGLSEMKVPAVPILFPLNLICKPKMAALMTGSKVFPTNFMGHDPKIIGFQPNDNPITMPIKADSMQANYQLQPRVQIRAHHFLFE